LRLNLRVLYAAAQMSLPIILYDRGLTSLTYARRSRHTVMRPVIFFLSDICEVADPYELLSGLKPIVGVQLVLVRSYGLMNWCTSVHSYIYDVPPVTNDLTNARKTSCCPCIWNVLTKKMMLSQTLSSFHRLLKTSPFGL